jgi:hypothetical protein
MTTGTSVDDCIEGAADLIPKLDEFASPRQKHAHVRLWFRGQSQSGLPLQPGVYRSGFAADEYSRLRKENHLTQDFRVLSAGIRTGQETDAEIYFLQQHYRMPTRLLDWTTSPLAALYFAASTDEADGELFMMDAYQIDPFNGIATSRRREFQDALGVIFDLEERNGFPKSYYCCTSRSF